MDREKARQELMDITEELHQWAIRYGFEYVTMFFCDSNNDGGTSFANIDPVYADLYEDLYVVISHTKEEEETDDECEDDCEGQQADY